MNATRRRIERRNSAGILTGVFETSLTDEELAEQNRQTAARRAALAAQGASIWDERCREQAEAEALEGVGVDRGAREHLRAAHQALAQARDDLAHRREVVAAAEAHVARCQGVYDAARAEVGRSGWRAAAAIVAQLERGELPQGQCPAPGPDSAVAARTDLEHAEAARTEVRALAGAAEAAFTAAEMRVKETARAVIRMRVSDLGAEIAALAERQQRLRGQLNLLLPTLVDRRWPTPWPADAAALLADPEAALDGEAEPAEEAAA